MLKKMADRYFFDKRDWKRRFVKYGIIFAMSFFPIVLFNIYCSKYFEKRWLLIFVVSVILLVFVVIGGYLANKIYEKKDAQLDKKQKERRALQEKKKQIMEDSYKKIREEKAKKKNSQKVDNQCNPSKTNKETINNKKTKSTSDKVNKNTKGRE